VGESERVRVFTRDGEEFITSSYTSKIKIEQIDYKSAIKFRIHPFSLVILPLASRT
jgi:hypothetical protein